MGKLLNRTRKLGLKLERMTMGGRRFAHKINVEAVKTVQDAVRVFRIMVFSARASSSTVQKTLL